jgi:hypothetical protein
MVAAATPPRRWAAVVGGGGRARRRSGWHDAATRAPLHHWAAVQMAANLGVFGLSGPGVAATMTGGRRRSGVTVDRRRATVWQGGEALPRLWSIDRRRAGP